MTGTPPTTDPASPARAGRILVADDERPIREILAEFLELEGFEVAMAADGETAWALLSSRPFDVILTDLKMPGLDGLDLLDRLRAAGSDVRAIIMTGFGTVETAILAMKRGAADYVLKPFQVEEVVHVIRRTLERQKLERENAELRETVSLYRVFEAMAQSLRIDHILDLVVDATLEETDADLVTLLLREPGTERYVERVRRAGPRLVDPDAHGRVAPGEILAGLGENRPLLVSGAAALRYLAAAEGAASGGAAPTSFVAVPLKVHDTVIGALTASSYTPGRVFSEHQRRMLAVLAARTAVSIDHARLYEDLLERNAELAQVNQTLAEHFRATLIGFAHALEEADRYTRGHSDRVSFYARLIAEGVGLPPAEIDRVVQAGLMHDIGKIGIRFERLNKPGRLSPDELAMFRTHPAKGKRILETMPFMAELIPGAWCHHEHWDGSGYPRGLHGGDIPLIGRIVAIADTYDAMTSDRSYRKALPHEVALSELRRCTGSQFDPDLAPVFEQKLEEHRREHGPA